MSVFDRLRLDGRRVFLTGGSRGLGREMALAMAGVGAEVTVTARNADDLGALAGEISRLGGRGNALEADMADPELCERACHEALERFGPFDILLNNVGGRRANVPLQDMPLDRWRALVDLNLTSTYLCCKVIGGAMIARGAGGRIINVASINGMVAGRGIEGRHYEAAKGAVLMLTRSLAVDWAKHGITVNAICPGIFGTDPNRAWARENPEIIEGLVRNIPMGKLGEPEDLGPLAVYLASDAARYVTGAAMVIDGGYTCL